MTVSTTGFVEYDGFATRCPDHYVGIPGTLFPLSRPGPDRDRDDRSESIRDIRPWAAPATAANTGAKLAAVHGERGKLYQKRQEMLELGPPAERLLTEWVHHPRINWKDQVEQLHELLLCHGPQRTLQAIQQVLHNGHHHVKAIAWILNQPSDVALDGEGRP